MFLIVVPIVAGIGNALLSVPLVRQLGRGAAGARVMVVARIRPMAECFERLPEVEEVRVMGKGTGGMFRSMREIAKLKPEAIVIPFPSNRWQYMALAMASGARRRILHGYSAGYVRAAHFLPAERIPAVRGMHDVRQNLELARRFGIEPDFAEAPTFVLTDDDRMQADALLAGEGIEPGAPFFAIHAGSATTVLAEAKRWPAARYAQLVELLLREHGMPVVLLEGPDEQGVADAIAAERAKTRAAAERLKIIRLRGPLAQAGAILARAKLYIGTDSGLAHLSAAVGTAPVTLFAPADPERVCPHGYRDLVVQPGCSCCPCFLYPFESTHPKMSRRNGRCIERITPKQVLDVVERALAGGTVSAGLG